ncbi:MAG: helix-turn-helix domain-containing protein [Allomuricauda sp.]
MDSNEVFFNLNPINFFIVSGLVQNFIIAGLLFLRQGGSILANKVLSFIICIVNFHLVYLMLLDTNLDNLFPFSLWIPYSYLTLIGPLIFLYTKTLTNINFKISDLHFRHFIPVIIEIGLQIIMIVQGILNESSFYNGPFYFYIMPLVYLCAIVSIFYYLNLSIKAIDNHEKWVLRNFSNLKELTLAWLKRLIHYYRVLWTVWIPFVATFLLFFKFQLIYPAVVLFLYLLMLFLTYLTYWIGVEGLRRDTLLFVRESEGHKENKNYSGLTAMEIQQYSDRINQLMVKEKKYLNENLSLRELAAYLEADPNLISFVLNKHLNSNFHDFVNKFRVEEVKNKLNDPANKNLTLLGIAFESGFNSKTTFNRVFKQVTGLTPTEFQKTKDKES